MLTKAKKKSKFKIFHLFHMICFLVLIVNVCSVLESKLVKSSTNTSKKDNYFYDPNLNSILRFKHLQLFIIRSCLLYTTSYTSEYTYISIMDRSANAAKSEPISEISTPATLPITNFVQTPSILYSSLLATYSAT